MFESREKEKELVDRKLNIIVNNSKRVDTSKLGKMMQLENLWV